MQASIAIDNARLYQETKNFNKVLQKKVDEQTQELKKRAEHLEKLLKMREEFLDIASHQLKTPVSVIRGTISMFRDGSMDKLPKAEQQRFLDNIYHKTEKLNVIISDILRASEIDSEDFKIDPLTAQPASLGDILTSISSDLKELAQDKGLALELILPKKSSFKVSTSADFLEQALYNLVDNAIKYTSKGSVTIELASADGQAIIKVSDTGIGIPEADKKKMFEKFSRAKNAVDLYADGSGLGLFIVKRIIEAHQGGSITFDSVENKGTTFTVKLPLVKSS
jgi:signal transduction histidine kinase